MAGSNIFVIYSDGRGNVTLSPRLGEGHFEPVHDTTANVTLLEGSGISGGLMVANVLCSNCESWKGGSTDFTSGSGSWIHASLQGDPLDSTDLGERIEQHQDRGSFTWDYSAAQGGNGDNPFVQASRGNNSVSSSPSGGGARTGSSGSSSESHGGMSNINMIVAAHGTLAAVAFLALFPIGSIFIRIPGLSKNVWVHASIQIFSYCTFIAAAGLGIYLARSFHRLSDAHPIIGLLLLGILFLQPFFGILHHSLFKKKQAHTPISRVHIWVGRLAIVLGMVNGGLGIKLAGNVMTGYKIAYGVVAGVMGVAYLAAVVYGEMKRKTGAPARSYGEQKDERQEGENRGVM